MTNPFAILDFDLNAASGRIALLQCAHETGLLSLAVATARAPEEADESMRKSVQIGPEWSPQGPRLSPDGSSLAFFGNGRLCVSDSSDGAARPVLDRPDLDASFCEWSPDGTQLVFSAFPPPGTRTEPGLGPDIYLLDISTPGVHPLTADFAVNRFPQWVGKECIAFHRQNPPRSGTPKKIVLVNTGTGKEMQLPSAADAVCQVSRCCGTPDGAYVAYSETGSAFTGIRVARAENGEVVWSLKREASCSALFTPNGRSILVIGSSGIEFLLFDFPGGGLRAQLTLELASPGVVRTQSGPAVGFRSDEEFLFLGTDSRIYRCDLGAGKCVALESPRGAPLPERPTGLSVQEETYESITRDGRRTPVHRFVPKAPKPFAVLFLHGGPPDSGTAAFAASSHFTRDLLLREGYEIIVPAYRGLDENEGEYGRADVWDVIDAARDWHQRLGKGRPLAVVGYSYGGYLTLMTLAESGATDTFSLAAALWPATQPFGLHMPRWFPTDADEPTRSARLPVVRAGDISAPLLILAGGRDRLATDPEVVTKIKRNLTERNVPCQAIIFADDGHGLPLNRAEAHSHLLAFLAKG